jgi:adenylate cyclase
VRKAGNRARITAQLIDAGTGNHLWADRFDGTLDDIFDLQDRITEQIVIAVEPEIAAAERARARLNPPQSLDAWETYQRGLSEFHKVTREDNARAIELLRKATALDPNFAAAWGMLGYALYVSTVLLFTQDAEQALADARAAAERAIALDTDEPEAHLALGRLFTLAGQHEMALEEMRTVVRANPNHARGYYNLGWVYWYRLADSATALEHYETALRLSPRDPVRFRILMAKGRALRTAGRLDEAIEVGRESCRYQGAGYLPRMHFAITLAKTGRIEEARALLQEVQELEPGLCLATVRAARRGMHPDMLADTVEGLVSIGLPETADEPIRS